jgi:nicotinate dehydrogenase subunit A
MPESTHFTVNGVDHTSTAAPDTPLLYVLRNDLKLKGAKFGCGLGQCGSCMVLLDGRSVTACDTPLFAAAGKSITTIEALGGLDAPNALQRAFIEEQAVQCGYCVSGMIMSATALLARNPHPNEEDIAQALARNLCRCGTHVRIVRAIRRASKELAQERSR